MRRVFLGLISIVCVCVFAYGTQAFAQCSPEQTKQLKRELKEARKIHNKTKKTLNKAINRVNKQESRTRNAQTNLERKQTIAATRPAQIRTRCDFRIDRARERRLKKYPSSAVECFLGMDLQQCLRLVQKYQEVERKIDMAKERCYARVTNAQIKADDQVAKAENKLVRAQENERLAKAQIPQAQAEFDAARANYIAAQAAYEACSTAPPPAAPPVTDPPATDPPPTAP